MAQHAHRLQRDLRELAAHDFSCSASNVRPALSLRPHLCQVMVLVNPCPAYDANDFTAAAALNLCVREGPYAQAHYSFVIHVPDVFPFRSPQIRSTVPVWHPNIDLNTGLVSLPLEWSPDLRLVDLAVNMQVRLCAVSTSAA